MSAASAEASRRLRGKNDRLLRRPPRRQRYRLSRSRRWHPYI